MADAMWWNYRIMKRWHGTEVYYGLVEVYYERSQGEDDPSLSWTENDIVVGDTPDEIKATLVMMLEDANRPVLDEKSIEANSNKEVKYHGNKDKQNSEESGE